MAKIIEHVKAKPTFCECCGSVYQWQEGDKVETLQAMIGHESIILGSLMECPSCGHMNKIEFIKEN